MLTASALAGIIPGAFVVALLPRAWLDVLIGVLIVLGVGTSIAARSGLDSDHRGPLAVAGVVSGAMNVTAGIGGPALAIYGVLTGWMGRGFAATIQPVFFATGTASVVAKFAIEPPSAEVWNPLVWILLIGGCIVGMLAGELLGRRMTPGVARVLLLVIALGGAIVVLVRGLLAVSGLAPPAD